MKLSEIIRQAGKTRTLLFAQPSAQTARVLGSIGASFDSELGGYVLEVNDPPQKSGSALIFHLTEPTERVSWISVRKSKGLYQIDAFG